MATEMGKMSTKGQVTIPKDVRDALGVRPGDRVRFDIEAGERVLLRKAEPSRLTEILDRLGPAPEAGLDFQRRVRREWSARAHGH